ncbi:hypothetical protein LUZ60_011856 [Juncus effusus]|nr:hypothetical protein LUZ60_011856 [Juncus effusus]
MGSTDNSNLFLQIVEHLDGSITRPFIPLAAPSPDPPVLSKDLVLNSDHNTSLRLYLPSKPTSQNQKLPVILFFHGGGFVLCSPSTAFYHDSCQAMAESLPALVISASYRLAPEARLPAAYEDAEEALKWVQTQAQNPLSSDNWLSTHADFSKFFLMGSSSGGNIAYHTALSAKSMDLTPLNLCGAILNQPYFGGVERTKTEENSQDDFMVPLIANDNLWRLSLPVGSDRDHGFCNPEKAVPGKARGIVRCLVLGCSGDPLFDRQNLFAELLERDGVEVVKKMDEGGFHAMELFVPEKGECLFKDVREFVYGKIGGN